MGIRFVGPAQSMNTRIPVGPRSPTRVANSLGALGTGGGFPDTPARRDTPVEPQSPVNPDPRDPRLPGRPIVDPPT